ncbi:MAG: RNA polymerase sigma factor [Dehalococcoidia bacterium]
MDELEVIRRSQRGESDVFRLLVERYGKVLFGTAYLMTHDRSLAEDMVQEALLLAWRSLPSFHSGTNFKAWLLRILVNRTLADRRKKRVAEVQLAEAMPDPPDHEDTEETVLSKEERRLVGQALNALSQDRRQAVVLRYYSDLTVPEVARVLGCREGTVKSRLHRALKQLRELLSSEQFQGQFMTAEVEP